jgi:uncharacterized protein (TIRG00374 family)
MTKKNWWSSKRFWLSLTISTLFLWWFARGIHWTDTLAALRHANYWFALPALMAYFAAVWFRAVRWHFILKPIKRIAASSLLPYVVIGYSANNLLPLRGGEIVRSYVASKREGIPFTSALATIAVERIFDGLVMLLFLLATAYNLPSSDNPIVNLILHSTEALFSLLFLVAILMVFFRKEAVKVFSWLLRPLPQKASALALGFIDHFIAGLEVIKHKRDVLIVIANSALFWLFEATMYGLVLASFMPVSQLGLAQFLHLSVFTVAFVNLFIIIPGAPGFWGIFHKGTMLALAIYAIPAAIAAPYAIVLHALLIIPITLWGLIYMLTLKVSLHSINKH